LKGRPLTDGLKEKIGQLRRNGLTTREISAKVAISFGAIAKYLRKAGIDPPDPSPISSTITEIFDAEFGDDETLVVTWAQNATPPHHGFLRALRAYCKHNRARLVIIPGRYKNPTSTWTASQQNEQWWSAELVPYLYNRRVKLGPNIALLADICVQPTAVSPLSGMETLSHGESSVIGHPKLQLKTVPTPHQRSPKIITTTGSVTRANYTDTKAGKKGDFNHVYGAVVLERSGKKFYLRHINARSDGAFCDLDKAYFADGKVRNAGPYAGLVFGDVHVDACDPVVLDATFNKLVKRLNPKVLVLHDLLDAYSVNPHHAGNPFIAVSKRQNDLDNLQDEVNRVIGWLQQYTGIRETVIVPSNHDDMFSRWMSRQDWRDDPTNAEYYLETALFMVRGIKHGINGTSTPDPLQYWIGRAKLPNVRCLKALESFIIKGIECGLHGHQGPNGARGSLLNLSRLGVKVITGHSHTPGIEAGHYKTGTMTPLSLEYTGPVSGWLNAHVAITPMGKRVIFVCVDGHFWKDRKVA
jgi:hypothetical protein